jgi:hypothetical protein
MYNNKENTTYDGTLVIDTTNFKNNLLIREKD